jgi:hypothetical protein
VTGRLALPQRRSIFRDDEPVIGSHPMLEGGKPPLFGDTDCWDLNGVLRRAPNMQAAGLRVWLRGLNPEWNLTARELAMIWLNQRHPGVVRSGRNAHRWCDACASHIAYASARDSFAKHDRAKTSRPFPLPL